MRECPPGFRLYAPVLQRIGEFRPFGSGISFRCLFPARHKHGDRNWSGHAWINHQGDLVAGCYGCGARRAEFIEAVGLPAWAWYSHQGKRERPMADGHRAVWACDYPYYDEHGKLVAVKSRFEPGFRPEQPKAFGWKRPLPDVYRQKFGIPKGKPAWVKGLDAGWFAKDKETDRAVYFGVKVDRLDNAACEVPAARPGLYRLPDVLANPGRLVLVCEGEKDADRLAGLGFVAVSGPNGSSQWPFEETGWLTDRPVAVIPDLDDPGVKLMQSAVAALISFRAKSVRWVDLPNREAKPGFDVSDLLAGLDAETARGTIERLVRESPAYTRGVAVASQPARKAA